MPKLEQNNKVTPYVLTETKSDIFEKEQTDHVCKDEAHKFGRAHGAYTSLRCSSNIYASSGYSKGGVDTVLNTYVNKVRVDK